MKVSAFAEVLLEWARVVQRPMPWRGERDPYKIWLSEVILQQTRVEQGEAYYLRFVEAFPEVQHLAAATEDEVLNLWQGLGYYSRARNLHASAKQVVAAGGSFPDTYKSLLELPGVGPYTAAAIASFAYDEPVAVVDGNVYRVLSRYFGIEAPIDKPSGQKLFRALAEDKLPPAHAAAYNQAIMDFGALVCRPKQPLCSTCPLADTCVALSQNKTQLLPIKEGKLKRRSRFFDYLHLEDSDQRIFLVRRGAGDIWQGLYDLPLLETASGFAERRAITKQLATWLDLNRHSVKLHAVLQPTKHVLSHQDLHARYSHYRIEASKPQLTLAGEWLTDTELASRGIPRLLDRYLNNCTPALQFETSP